MTVDGATSANGRGQRRRRRHNLDSGLKFRQSILDRTALIEVLEERGLYGGSAVQPCHITTFYQSLHRQHYPELKLFVDNYYMYETQPRRIKNNNKNNFATPAGVVDGQQPARRTNSNNMLIVGNNKNNNNDDDDSNMDYFGVPRNKRPLKNNVSKRKNRNKQQLPKIFLDFLLAADKHNFVTVTSTVAQQKTSSDGSTTKLAIQLQDGNLVESVIMRYTRTQQGRAASSSSRASLCVSSQCGCAMGCTFCATGTMGLSGNLTTGEILEQIVHADRILAQEWQELVKENVNRDNNNVDTTANNTRASLPNVDLVRNVVFMGMGEPLDNYNNVVEACRALIDRKRWNLAHGRVTVSTVGIVSKIRKLTEELPGVNLALSLHAPNQEMRQAIVPTAKHYPIEQLIDALDGHMMAYLKQRKVRERNKESNNNSGSAAVVGNEGTSSSSSSFTFEERVKESSRRRAMIEYVMLVGETSTLEAAHQLGKLCEGRQLLVNLIPYNQTDVKDKLRCPSKEHMEQFRSIVASYGTFCTVRRTMGADIDSACGQLITLEKNKQDLTVSADDDGASTGNIPDIEDVVSTTMSQGSKAAVRNAENVSDKTKEDSFVDNAEEPMAVDLEPWIRPLAYATTMAACSFLVTTLLFLTQKKRR